MSGQGGALRFTILGSGSSGGVPRVGGDWGACDPAEPRNRRSRCGFLVQRFADAGREPKRATTVLVDTPPDLRTQLLAADVRHLDAVLYTHAHADQSHGIDDVRALAQAQGPIPVYMDDDTRPELRRSFGYCFDGASGGYPAILRDAGVLKPFAPLGIDGPGGPIKAMPLPLDHGVVRSMGFRIGAAAYCNDVVRIPEETFAALGALELFIVDALRYRPHPTHAHVDLALAWIERLRPTRAVLTNLHVDLDYGTLAAALPSGVEPAYDGWWCELPI